VCSDELFVLDGAGLVASRNVVFVGASDDVACQPAAGRLTMTLPARVWLDRSHVISAAAVGFARGLSDTPRIAALMFASGAMGVASAAMAVVVAMALGGLLAARRVSETMTFRVTRMGAGEGLGGNLVTATLAIGASHVGMPVSTTHVSTGALFGITAGNGSGLAGVIRSILPARLTTLPAVVVPAYATRSLLA